MAVVLSPGTCDAKVVCSKCGATVGYNYSEVQKHMVGYKGAKTVYGHSLKLPCCGHVISFGSSYVGGNNGM